MEKRVADRSLPRIGIYGGSFDPIHYGHIAVADAALAEMELDHLIFVPTVAPPHKTGRTPYPHRLAMLQAALSERQERRFVLSTLEEELPVPSYTINTIKALLTRQKGAFFFVLGVDAFLEIRSWEGYEEILSLVNMVISPRKGYSVKQLESLMVSLKYSPVAGGWQRQRFKNIFLLKSVPPLISSSDIKIALHDGVEQEDMSLRLLSPEVMDYIRTNHLYGG